MRRLIPQLNAKYEDIFKRKYNLTSSGQTMQKETNFRLRYRTLAKKQGMPSFEKVIIVQSVVRDWKSLSTALLLSHFDEMAMEKRSGSLEKDEEMTSFSEVLVDSVGLDDGSMSAGSAHGELEDNSMAGKNETLSRLTYLGLLVSLLAICSHIPTARWKMYRSTWERLTSSIWGKGKM